MFGRQISYFFFSLSLYIYILAEEIECVGKYACEMIYTVSAVNRLNNRINVRMFYLIDQNHFGNSRIFQQVADFLIYQLEYYICCRNEHFHELMSVNELYLYDK